MQKVLYLNYVSTCRCKFNPNSSAEIRDSLNYFGFHGSRQIIPLYLMRSSKYGAGIKFYITSTCNFYNFFFWNRDWKLCIKNTLQCKVVFIL